MQIWKCDLCNKEVKHGELNLISIVFEYYIRGQYTPKVNSNETVEYWQTTNRTKVKDYDRYELCEECCTYYRESYRDLKNKLEINDKK